MVSQSVLKEDIGVTFHNSKKDIEEIANERDISINPVYNHIYSGKIQLTRILSIHQPINNK